VKLIDFLLQRQRAP